MENVHKTSFRPWISKRISVRKFRDDWHELIKKAEKCNDLKTCVSEKEYSKIENECSLDAMRCPDQQNIEITSELIIPENVDLETLRIQKQDLEKRRNDPQYDAVVYSYNRFYNYPLYQKDSISQQKNSEASSANTFEGITEPEVILNVQIFKPEKRNTNRMRNGPTRSPKFIIDQEFLVLGGQCLTELRDKIDCISDKAVPGDFSENPNEPIEVTCADLYKSGFFYIDGVFYNDMRHPDCRDYSETIIKWTEMKDRGIGPFRKLKMECTTFIDLEIQLGYPYVYVHQGNCEHFLVFSDLMMYSQHHNPNKKEYPLYGNLKPKKRVFCMVCHIHTAEWIVYNSKRVPETPFYFCKSCFFSFNYDNAGQKIGDFQAYHHIDRSSII